VQKVNLLKQTDFSLFSSCGPFLSKKKSRGPSHYPWKKDHNFKIKRSLFNFLHGQMKSFYYKKLANTVFFWVHDMPNTNTTI
jgi:hypothetical protein